MVDVSTLSREMNNMFLGGQTRLSREQAEVRNHETSKILEFLDCWKIQMDERGINDPILIAESIIP